ncbi:MAG: SMI1/KNR4 family protein [Proteobacteria bacterium]|nr:SMI1/KNR4 family protein [Pseudomonadota bacterium]
MKFEKFVDELVAAGWKLEVEPSPLDLPKSILARYPALPEAINDFICSLKLLANPSETAWFLTGADFNGQSESAFAWDEFERLSVEAADGDPQLLSEIHEFWDGHIPLMLSVKTGYSYFALRVRGQDSGCVVHGFEPEFEDAAAESDSFEGFLSILAQATKGELGDSAITAAV